MTQFPQGAPRGAPVHVFDEVPYVLVVWDSVRGYVGSCPQRCCSKSNWEVVSSRGVLSTRAPRLGYRYSLSLIVCFTSFIR